MEKRSWWIIGGLAAGLAMLGCEQYYTSQIEQEEAKALAKKIEAAPRAQTAAKTQNPAPEKDLAAEIAAMDRGESEPEPGAVKSLMAELEETEPQELTDEARAQAARLLISAYDKAGKGEPADEELQRGIVESLLTRVGGAEARGFAQVLLSSGTDEMKLEAVRGLGESRLVRGKALYAQALAAAKLPFVPEDERPALIGRFAGKDAGAELAAFCAPVHEPDSLRACAVAVQDLGRPELMGGVLAGLDKAGLLGDARRMPWISGKLLAEYMKTAEGPDLARALSAVQGRPALAGAAAGVLKERLTHSDPRIRGAAAKLIPAAVASSGLALSEGEGILTAQLKAETDAGVKGVIESSLTLIRGGPQEAQVH